MQGDVGGWGEMAQLVRAMIHQTLHIFRIELARDQHKAVLGADDTRSWPNEF